MPLVLASESPRRRELLAKLGIRFRVRTAAVREFVSGELPAGELPLRNAELKALATARLEPESLVLGADTVIVSAGAAVGKPRDIDDARRILKNLSGGTHQVITAVALIRLSDDVRRIWSESTAVTFKPFDDATIEAYLARVNVLDKAGAYALQEYPEMLVESVSGDVDNVVGLPLSGVSRELASLTF